MWLLARRRPKRRDPNHLLTYSMIGGIFGEADAHYTCEDAKSIVARCADAGRAAQFLVDQQLCLNFAYVELAFRRLWDRQTQGRVGLPVMVSETRALQHRWIG